MTKQERGPHDEPERAPSVLRRLVGVVAVEMEKLQEGLRKLWDSQWIETGREWIREATEGIRRRRKRDD
jgi:hypothetical protein